MRLYVTIDTEPDCDTSWRRSNPLTFSSVTEGVPLILRPLWNRYQINPIYFVSPEVVRDDESCVILRREIREGAEIGAHLHSEYIEPDMTIADAAGKVSEEFPCFAHATDIEQAKIKNLTRLIEERLDYHPVWYRAARYGADIDTIHILSKLGYRYDSSITPGIDWSGIGGPDHTAAPLQPYWISKDDMYSGTERESSAGIQEYPITIWGKRFGFVGSLTPDTWMFYNWLRPTHMTVWEEKSLIKRMAKRYEDATLVMLFHSMEIMINRSPFVRNRMMQRRFVKNLEQIFEFARRMGGG